MISCSQTKNDIDGDNNGDIDGDNNGDNDGNNDGDNDIDDDIDDDDKINQTDVFYIMTLGVIEKYRKRGLASYLVEKALQDQIVTARDDVCDADNGDDNGNGNDEEPGNASDVCEDFADAEIYQGQTAETTTEVNVNHTSAAFDVDASFPPSFNRYRCETVYLHVIIQNQAAIRFYEKLGFSRLREIANYYTINEEKYNCYLYAKFYDRASIAKRQHRYDLFFCYGPLRALVDGAGLTTTIPMPPFLADLVPLVARWIASVWSSISYYWIFDGGEGGRNSALAAAAKNK